MTEPRCVFHTGWSTRGAPAGVVMVRADTKASVPDTSVRGSMGVICVAFRESADYDRPITTTRDGKPVWIRPRRGCREGAPAARQLLYPMPLRARSLPIALVVAAAVAACSSPVDGSAVAGPRDVDQAYFFAGDIALYGRHVNTDDVAALAYLRALRRIDVCGLLTGEALGKIGQTV